MVFNDQTVGDACKGTAPPDSVNVAKAVFPGNLLVNCGGGFVDIHDADTNTGPSGTFGAGYPLGATTWFPTGTHTDVCIEVFSGNDDGKFGECVGWTREQWTTKGTMRAILHLDTNNSRTFEHYCQHEGGHENAVDHAYLCNNTPPVTDSFATIYSDGIDVRVGVWVTQEQYNATGYDVRDRVVIYLENSDSNTPLNVNAIGKTELPNPDEECPQAAFEDTKPCDPTGKEVMWDDLYQWWRKYVDCKDITAEPDCNLLVSRCTDPPCGSGLGEGTLAVANGNNIENLPSSYTLFDNSCGAYSMGITIQEVGHCLITGVSDDDGDGHAEHDTCDDRIHGGDVYTTPMGVGYHDELTDDNECGDSDGGTVTDPTGKKYVHFEYDDCAGSHMI